MAGLGRVYCTKVLVKIIISLVSTCIVYIFLFSYYSGVTCMGHGRKGLSERPEEVLAGWLLASCVHPSSYYLFMFQ
jgi:hypothetical protein